jgi:hypothetical protein
MTTHQPAPNLRQPDATLDALMANRNFIDESVADGFFVRSIFRKSLGASIVGASTAVAGAYAVQSQGEPTRLLGGLLIAGGIITLGGTLWRVYDHVSEFVEDRAAYFHNHHNAVLTETHDAPVSARPAVTGMYGSCRDR